jgi:CRP/FNR family transcriptional regulator, cyclic AMP receptor protein
MNKCDKNEVIDSNLLLLLGGAFKNYEKDEYIFHEDQQPHFYHQVVEGRVKMMNETDDGKEFIQGVFSAGQSFGEPPIFLDMPYPASAIALQPTTILRLTSASFLDLLHQNFDAHLNITRLLSRRLRSKSIILKEISCHTPEHKILTLLNNIKKEANGGIEEGAPRVKIEYTRKQLAEMTGLRVETVIRVVRSLFDKKMLIIENGKVFF